MTDTTCGLCQRPTRDAAYVCDPCGDTFAKLLKAFADELAEDLETCIAGTKGVDWRSGPHRQVAHESGMRIHWRAAEVYRSLHRALSEAVDHCMRAHICHSSPSEAEPSRVAPTMALWLTWRTDGLTLDPAGVKHIGGITDLLGSAKRIAEWDPPPRRFLGPCAICGEGHVYAEGDDIEANCDRCEAAFAADILRAELVSTMDDQLLTAAEIADLSTYLGLHRGREKVRKQVNRWSHRKVIEVRSGEGDTARFRLGDVRHRLVAQDEAG